ncbi:MAG: hypothetical protein Q4B70_19565 [Lachnospiraceae bacterium]|nr:hypothetical protein [Lachnospiraceae bacterium]
MKHMDSVNKTHAQNINNAFKVVFKTLESVENLINCCISKFDQEQYHLPTERFLRFSSDRTWQGWIYWSFILIFQRTEDGPLEKNNWINGPLYAVEIDLDAEVNENAPQLLIAKMEYDDIGEWPEGLSPSEHGKFYDPIHEEKYFEGKDLEDGLRCVVPKRSCEDTVKRSYKNLRRTIVKRLPLVEITEENYLDEIFGGIEQLAKLPLK